MTRQRALILRIVRASCDHLTADEIYRLAQEEMPGIARATVYNNLNVLAASGEIVRLHTSDGADHFDHAEHPHGHLVCDTCGAIRDVELPNSLMTYASRNWGVDPAMLEVSGRCLCESCRTKETLISDTNV